MKKLLVAMLALAALQGPVFAQLQGRERVKTPLQIEEEQKKKAAEKADREYQTEMKKAQGQAAPQAVIDPWANMRAVDSTQPKR